MTNNVYPDSVTRLIHYGSTFGRPDWPDYKTELGLTKAEIPDLTRVITDPAFSVEAEESSKAWAPTHAWRALAQLKSTEAIAPMLKLIESDSMLAVFDFPKVAAEIGPPAIEPLSAVLTDMDAADAVRAAAVDGLAAIGKKHPEARQPAMDLLVRQLTAPRLNSIDVNAAIVKALRDLEAREALPAIKKAFLDQQVDLTEVTWDEVNDALGG